jgi:acetylornithine deacetylase/succinyl-diaminopimelate desuccinylase-like protein
MRLVLRSLLAILVAPAILSAPAAENAAESESRLKESVTYLSSDELEGRGVGTEGLNKAAEYLASQFAQLGLKTDLYDGTPFQKFEVTVTTEMGPAEQNRLTLWGPPVEGDKPRPAALKLGEEFTPLATGGSGTFDAPLVFAGYGITAKGLKQGDKTIDYDDYASIDVKDKVVIILRKEPQQADEKSPFDGAKASQHALFNRKLANASEHGAAAVIFINDGNELATRREESRKSLLASLDKLAKLRTDLEAAADPAVKAKLAGEIAAVAEEAAALGKSLANVDTLLTFQGAGDESSHRKLPVYFVTRSAIELAIKEVLGKDLSALEAEIDADLMPRSAVLGNWKALGEASVLQKKADVKNVVAVLEGEGPLANETIVVGAHYDHLGLGGAGSLAPWTTDIHNGADDNASGTATLLEVARRLATTASKPRRRIVFIAFTGEEKGLLGSAHYTREPRFPLENTVAMFNLDMVGRLTENKLQVFGTGTAKEFEPLVDKLGEQYGFQIAKHPGGFGPSDHSSFYAKKIPVLHLFTGTHSDYHRPSDDSPKINVEGMRRVADMLVDIVQATDSADQKPNYLEIKRVEAIGGGDGDRPYFGSIPDFGGNAEGLLLSGVVEGGPAEKAGLKGGDVIVQLADSKITGIEDFDMRSQAQAGRQNQGYGSARRQVH